MNRLIKILLLISFFAFVTIVSFAQQSLVDKGNEEFLHKDYVKAESFYFKALQFAEGEEKSELYKKIADCNRLMNELELAVEHYNQYVQITSNPDKEALFDFATVLLETGYIERSKTLFENLLKESSNDPELNRMIACCNFALAEKAKKNLPDIVNQEALNSKQSEFGLAWFDSRLLFASKRLTSDFSTIHGRTNQGFSDLYWASYDTLFQQYANPVLLKGGINTPYNDGTFTYSNQTNTAFFSQCKKSPEICGIYKGTYEDGKWKDISLLSFYNKDSYNFSHPTLSSDGRTLYFVSDMPGGKGGKDIWKANLTPVGTLINVENLGETINTDKNEMFPLILNDSVLFFSSDGHIGMGGLDIFYSKLKDKLFTNPVNLGAPINSTSDDFSIIFNDDLNGGFFCSNRENKEKSDDIYGFSHNIFHSSIKGIVNDSLELFPLDNVKITYYTDNKVEAITSTNVEGKFEFPYCSHNDCGKKHQLIFEKDGYVRKIMNVACDVQKPMVVLMWNGEIVSNTLAGKVTNKQDGKPISGAHVVITSAKGVKDEVLTDFEGMYVSTKIKSNDFYNIRVTSEGFLSDSKKIMVPESSSSLVISDKNGYDTNFELIPAVLESEFKIDNIYYEFNKANLLPESKRELDNLVNILNENPNITIRINSHTDSRGSNKYNQKLSESRSASVVNYLIDQGIERIRLFSKGFGESALLVENAQTEEEHQFNRRTTFEIIGTTFNSKVINQGLETEKSIKEKYTHPVGKEDKQVVSSPKIKEGFGIQLFASSSLTDAQKELNKIKEFVDRYGLNIEKAEGLNKYQLGPIGTREEATKVKELLISKGFNGCFLVEMKN